MNKPSLGPRRIVYQNAFLKISRVRVQFPGFAKTIFVSHYGPRAGVLLLQNEKVLFVRQYRLLVNGLALEIPGGKVEDAEPPRTAALRECMEETCLRCLNLKPLLFYQPGLDTDDNPTSVFYCTRSQPVPRQKLDRREIAELVWIPFSRCVEMVFAKQIVDGLSVAAILAWQVRKRRRHV